MNSPKNSRSNNDNSLHCWVLIECVGPSWRGHKHCYHRRPTKRACWQELMPYLVHKEQCRDIIQKILEAFLNLCSYEGWMLVNSGGTSC